LFFFKKVYLSFDIWNDITSQSEPSRQATIGYSMKIPAICSTDKYTIMEFGGFNKST